MYKTIYDYLEKELDCSYHYTDTDSIFMEKNIFSSMEKKKECI